MKPSTTMPTQRFPYHDESTAVVVHASAERVFAHLDDPKSLSAHMGESSMMMMGSRMSIDVDAGGGQIGSKIRMVGRVMGIPVSLEEVICERQAPYKKRWETVGTPKLIVIGHYRMGFDVTPSGDSSRVRVFIDYGLPTGFVGQCLGRVFGPVYARWCTQRMARDAAEQFPREPVKENT